MAIYSDEQDPNVIMWEKQERKLAKERKREKAKKVQLKNKRHGNKKSSLRN